MSYAAEAAAIEAKFTTDWASATPIAYDNVQYKPTPGTNYVQLEIHTGEGQRASLGDTYTERSVGIISINIFTAINTGTRSGRTLADTAAAVFRGWATSEIICRTATITRLGAVGEWFVTNVSVPFYRDEQFS